MSDDKKDYYGEEAFSHLPADYGQRCTDNFRREQERVVSDGKEVNLITKPPRNCQYLTWCNDCEEAVPHEEGSCAGCASLDLLYFVKESDHLAAMVELRAESNKLCHQIVELASQVATQARVIEELKDKLETANSYFDQIRERS